MSVHVLGRLFLLVQMGYQAPGAGISNPDSACHASYQAQTKSPSDRPDPRVLRGHGHRGAQLESHRAVEGNLQVCDRRRIDLNEVVDARPSSAVTMSVMSATSCPHPTSMALHVEVRHLQSMTSCQGVRESGLRDRDAVGCQTAQDQDHL